MSKICPLTDEPVLYADCLECEDRGKCSETKAEKPTFALLVVGSRSITDEEFVEKKIDKMISQIRDRYNILIVSGGAGGVDSIAEKYARKNGMEMRVMPVDWKRYGRSAGYIRNREMHEYISGFERRGVIAVWDGISRGTAMNFTLAKEFKNEIKVIRYRRKPDEIQ